MATATDQAQVEARNMQQLATAIRGHAESLVDQYDARLRTMAGYNHLPENVRRELEHNVLDLIAQCLEAADHSALIQYVLGRASQWVDMGLDLTWFQQAFIVPEDILVPLIDSAEASTFLWRALNRSQSAIWLMVAERAHQTEQALRQSQQLLQTVMDNLQTAAEVSRAASSILGLDDLLPQAVELVRARFNLYYVGIFLLDESGQWATLRAGTGEAGQQMLAAGHKLNIRGSSMISWCVVNRQARIALDVGEDAVRFDNPVLPLTRSELALPLISRGSVIGAVTIQSDQPAAFTAEDITILQTMADQIGNATENARLFEQSRAALQEVDAINRRLTGEAWESYLRRRSSRQVISVSNNDESAPAPLSKVDEILSTGQIIIEPTEDQSQATVTAPLMLRGQTIGALRVQTPMASWNEDVQTILASIAGHVAQAAENARLLNETEGRLARERALGEATDKIRRRSEVEHILQTAAEELARYFQASHVAVHIESTSEADVPSSKPAGNGQN